MVSRLKADLHIHTAEDPRDNISYSARDIIDRGGELGFDVLCITNHDVVTYDDDLAAYAEKKGILLIPGIEVTLSNKHVVIVNPGFKKTPPGSRLQDLAELKNGQNLVIAPHPFFIGFKSLLTNFYSYLPLFDAVEYAHYYSRLIDMNKKAIAAAAKYHKPMVATSDCHNLWQFGTSYTYVYSEKEPAAILAAIKEGRMDLVTSPLSMPTMIRIAFNFLLCDRLKLPFRI
jgi:predicted metal-dependent phosphoesterase TrpH